jgi:hypothetical protein
MFSLVDTSRPFAFTPPNLTLGDQETFFTNLIKTLKYVYWVVGGLGLMAICYTMYQVYTRQVAAILIFIGGIIVLYYYFIKWFYTSDDKTWPTGQSLCPDYLTPISPGFKRRFDGSIDPNQSDNFQCVDFVGVSTNGALLKTDPANVQGALQDPNANVTITPKMGSKDIQEMLRSKGLTWIAMFGDDS